MKANYNYVMVLRKNPPDPKSNPNPNLTLILHGVVFRGGGEWAGVRDTPYFI